MTDRWPRRALLWAGLAVGALIAAAFVDHAVSYDSLPEIENFADASESVLEEREDLRDAYVVRAWLYALGIVAAVGALLFAGLRFAAPEDRRDLFRDLGATGVVFLFAGWLIHSQEPYLISEASGEAIVAVPGIVMLVAAAAGGIATRRGASGEPFGVRSWLASIPPVALAAAGLAALTLLLVLVAQPGSECGGDAPGWKGTVLGLALLTGIAAGACGLAAFFKRRWLAALVSIPAPLLGLIGLVVAACLE